MSNAFELILRNLQAPKQTLENNDETEKPVFSALRKPSGAPQPAWFRILGYNINLDPGRVPGCP